MPVVRYGGFDPLLALTSALKEADIDQELVAAVMDNDREAVDALAMILLERIRDRNKLASEGHTHLQSRGLGISDSLIDYLLIIALEAPVSFFGELPVAVSYERGLLLVTFMIFISVSLASLFGGQVKERGAVT